MTDMTMIRTGRVDHINYRGGYGFIKPDDHGKDIFFHFDALQKSGLAKLPIGSAVEYTTVETDDGLLVDKILTVGDRKTEGAAAINFGISDWVQTAVKWFNRDTGYGFLVSMDRNEEIFVHIETVRACGFYGLTEGQRVAARYISRGAKGLRAVEIAEPLETGF